MKSTRPGLLPPEPEGPTLVLDSNFLCWQARHTTGGLSLGDLRTGIVYGFLARVLHLAQTFKTREVVCIWDSKSSLRRDLFPDYKLHRRTADKTLGEQQEDRVAYEQFDALRREILPTIGLRNSYVQPGYEADDLIARVVSGTGDWLVVTSDEDMYQLLAANVRLYNPARRRMMTASRFREEYGLAPRDWVRVKAIGGCSSDGVPGVPGVAQKTAIKYLRGLLLPHHKAYQAIESPEGMERMAFNLPLVSLPFPGARRPPIRPWGVSRKGLVQVKRAYGMETMDVEEWMEVLG